MHGEFPSDAWCKINAREKTFLKVKRMYFQQKSLKTIMRNFSKYIVAEIKTFLICLVSEGMNFIIYKLINFG